MRRLSGLVQSAFTFVSWQASSTNSQNRANLVINFSPLRAFFDSSQKISDETNLGRPSFKPLMGTLIPQSGFSSEFLDTTKSMMPQNAFQTSDT